MAKITKRTVDAVIPKASGRFIVWDSEIKGFGLQVLPTGMKSYIYNYRNNSQRARRITIGKHGGGLTPEVARTKAEGFRREVLAGGDPVADKFKVREAMHVGDLLDQYLLSESFSAKASSTQSVDRGRIARHLRPLMGKLPVSSLTVREIERAYREIKEGKTAIDIPSGRNRGRARVTGGEGTARMAIRLFRSILTWGRKRQIISSDIVEIARHVEIGRDGRRTAIIDSQAAYATLFRTLDKLSEPSNADVNGGILQKVAADAIRVLALTGARRGEILGLKWSQVDLKAGTLNLPANAHKTGHKTGEVRIIGLPELAAAIIQKQKGGGAEDLVFKPARGGARLDLSKPWQIVRKAAGFSEELGLHGLRHSLASHMAMQGAGASEIMTALGHRDMATSQKYVHFSQNLRQGLAERAAETISAAMSQSETGSKLREEGNRRSSRVSK